MLVKNVKPHGICMFHRGVRYAFDVNQVQECPDDIVQAFPGALVELKQYNRLKVIDIAKVQEQVNRKEAERPNFAEKMRLAKEKKKQERLLAGKK